MRTIRNVKDIADWRLCLGCGACSYVCPEKKVSLRDVYAEGIRPQVRDTDCGTCTDCLDVCPASENDHSGINSAASLIEELIPSYGPVLEVWEGNAADPEIRFKGSSGGVLTAIAAYCLEKAGMHGVLHIAQDGEWPFANRTVLSTKREELLARTGSRYAPASACDRLEVIEKAPAPCVFIGQPSEVTAASKARTMRPDLDRNLGLTLSFFCAGSPSTRGTVELMKTLGVEPAEVASYRYRGNGWPGNFAVKGKVAPIDGPETSYRKSWGIVQAYRPLSTHLCPDGSGEDADISCGDPWYQEVQKDNPGSSLVLVRTERGRRILREAMEAGYLELEPAEAWKVLKSQEGLTAKRGAVGGRVAVMRMLGIPAPRLRGFALFRNWRALGFEEKLRSTLGSLRRAIQRGYFRRLRLEDMPTTRGALASSSQPPAES